MALIKCPECGKEVSDRSDVCIHCGYPIKGNIEKIADEKIEEDEYYFTICNKCGNFAFTNKLRILNTIKSIGFPTCMWCGGEIKILAGKRKWMIKNEFERESIVWEETQRVLSNPKFDVQAANTHGKGNGIRPDLDLQGYCPKCAAEYSKSKALRKGLTNCEFCGSEIKYSDMLASDFIELFVKEKERLGIGNLINDEPVCIFIRKIFNLEDGEFSEELFHKRYDTTSCVDNPLKNSSNMAPKSMLTDTENTICMIVGLIGSLVCFFGFVLNDHSFLAFVTASLCIAFGMWRSTKLSDEMQRQIGEIERQKEIKKKNRTGNISCPYCNSNNIQKITAIGRAVSISAMGAASSKLGKQWHCNNCNSNF